MSPLGDMIVSDLPGANAHLLTLSIWPFTLATVEIYKDEPDQHLYLQLERETIGEVDDTIKKKLDIVLADSGGSVKKTIRSNAKSTAVQIPVVNIAKAFECQLQKLRIPLINGEKYTGVVQRVDTRAFEYAGTFLENQLALICHFEGPVSELARGNCMARGKFGNLDVKCLNGILNRRKASVIKHTCIIHCLYLL